MMDKKVNIMIDSGAFSAWKLGNNIDLDAYCAWLHANQEWIGPYVSLDVINPNDPEVAAKASFQNLLYMRKQGLDPIPVFHVGESIDWLKRMLDLDCAYIGLSATSIVSRNDANDWYELAWWNLVNHAGYPTVSVHAFGETTETILRRYPWQSADSSSWLSGAKYGNIKGAEGEVALKSLDVADAIALADAYGVRKELLLDFDSEASRTALTYISIRNMLDMEKRVNAALPISFRANTGLMTSYSDRPAVNIDKFDLYLSATSSDTFLAYMEDVPNILLSYFYLNDKKTALFEQFARDPMSIIGQEFCRKQRTLIQEIRTDARN